MFLCVNFKRRKREVEFWEGGRQKKGDLFWTNERKIAGGWARKRERERGNNKTDPLNKAHHYHQLKEEKEEKQVIELLETSAFSLYFIFLLLLVLVVLVVGGRAFIENMNNTHLSFPPPPRLFLPLPPAPSPLPPFSLVVEI